MEVGAKIRVWFRGTCDSIRMVSRQDFGQLGGLAFELAVIASIALFAVGGKRFATQIVVGPCRTGELFRPSCARRTVITTRASLKVGGVSTIAVRASRALFTIRLLLGVLVSSSFAIDSMLGDCWALVALGARLGCGGVRSTFTVEASITVSSRLHSLAWISTDDV